MSYQSVMRVDLAAATELCIFLPDMGRRFFFPDLSVEHKNILFYAAPSCEALLLRFSIPVCTIIVEMYYKIDPEP
jgi:hypothetical protein